MLDSIDTWLASCPDPASDPIQGMREAGLLEPASDYATIARLKAALVERTGLLGIGSVWGGRQLVYRHFLSFGTEAQRLEWARRALSVAISEPKVGAHPKLLTTRAEPVEGGFRISGQKAWVTNGPSADAIIVFAITAEDDGRKRYSAFIVPRETPALTTADMPGFHALRPSRHCLMTLDGCFVPESAMLGPSGSAYERMALPFRDIEDAVGTFGTLGALRYALSQFADAALEQTEDLGAIVALTAVFAAGAETVVGSLDDGRVHTSNAALVGLRVLAADIVARLRSFAERAQIANILADLDATLSIARGPRLARQTQLGADAIRAVRNP
jgi:acyl-CoA dehydrogenase